MKVSKTAKKLIVSYLIIGIIPIFTLTGIYCYDLIQRTSEKLQQDLVQKITQIHLNLDSKINQLNTVNTHLSKLIEENNEFTQKSSEIQQQLNIYKENAPFISDIFFYNKKSNIIVSSAEVSSGADLENYFEKKANLMASDFYRIILSAQTNYLFSLRQSSPYTNLNSDYVIYSTPIPQYAANSIGSSFYVMHTDSLADIFTDYLGQQQGLFCVLNENNNLAFYKNNLSQQENTNKMIDMVKMVKGIGYSEIKLNENNYVVARSISDQFGYRYCIVIPKENFYAPLNNRITVFFIMIGCIVSVVSLLAIFITYKQYKPIRHMLETVGIHPLDGENEYEAIIHRYKKVETEQKKLMIQLTDHSEFIKNNVLNRILNGRLKNIGFYMQCANLAFNENRFIVFAFCPQDRKKNLEFPSEVQLSYGVAYGIELVAEKTFCFLINLTARYVRILIKNVMYFVMRFYHVWIRYQKRLFFVVLVIW